MLKKIMKKKTDSLFSAVGGMAVLVGSYMIMAAVNTLLERRGKT